MNMVRVQDAGRYQRDAFCMPPTASACYTGRKWPSKRALPARRPRSYALDSREVDEQVRRRKTHPSIVIWGGNNENEGSMHWSRRRRPSKWW